MTDGLAGWCVAGSAAAGGPGDSSPSSSSSGPPPAPRSSGSRGLHGTPGVCGPVGASAAAASGSAGTSGSVGNRRMYGIKSLSWKALWNLREILGGRLSKKVRGPISASMLKGPEALGANGCLCRSWFLGCFAALTRTRSPTWNRCTLM